MRRLFSSRTAAAAAAPAADSLPPAAAAAAPVLQAEAWARELGAAQPLPQRLAALSRLLALLAEQQATQLPPGGAAQLWPALRDLLMPPAGQPSTVRHRVFSVLFYLIRRTLDEPGIRAHFFEVGHGDAVGGQGGKQDGCG